MSVDIPDFVVNRDMENVQAAGNQFPAFEFNGSGATTVLNMDRIEAANPIIFNDSVEIDAASVTLDTTDSGAAAGGANIVITGALNSVSGEVNALILDAGTGGDITLAGDVGTVDSLETITVNEANAVTLRGAVRIGEAGVASALDIGGVAGGEEVDRVTIL